MIKHITQPIKVIDNFFEQPQLVVKHAIKQEYSDQDNSLFLGTRSTSLDMIDIDMFEGLLGKLINHVVGKDQFSFLHCEYQNINIECVDQIKMIGPAYNIAGTVFLTKENLILDSGIKFYDSRTQTETMSVENVFNRCVLWDPQVPYKISNFADNTLMLTFYGTTLQRYPG
jgi:hypothetical protein